MIRLRDLLNKELETLIPTAGVNGPYNEPETRVRNLSHYISTICLAEKQNIKIPQNSLSVHDALDELISNGHKPMNASYWCRSNPKKDFCNGVMGQAWVLEALTLYAECFNCKAALSEASRLYERHPYSDSELIWQRVAVDGMFLPFDSTFNHQLWFAAVSSRLQNEMAKRHSENFLELLSSDLILYKNGIIKHTSPMGCRNGSLKALVKKSVIKYDSLLSKERHKLYYKSIGYHAFNLYALAMLKEEFPSHLFWESKKFKLMLDVTKSKTFIDLVINNKYGMYYNPSGVELCFVGEIFNLGREYCERFLNLQMKQTFCSKTNKLLVRNSPDYHTSAARIYEAFRIQGEYELNY